MERDNADVKEVKLLSTRNDDLAPPSGSVLGIAELPSIDENQFAAIERRIKLGYSMGSSPSQEGWIKLP